MTYHYEARRRIEFAETDMAGIVHFSHYFRFMEWAEHEFFRSLGFALHHEEDGMMTGFVRVRADCQFLAPLRYQDEVLVRLMVRSKTAKAMSYDFVIAKVTTEDGVEVQQECAHGLLEVVCVRKPVGGGKLKAIDIPPAIDAALEVAPPDLLLTRDGGGRRKS